MKKYDFNHYSKRTKIMKKKNAIKKTRLKAKLPAGAATKKPPLSSLLASIGVNTEIVINTFNTQTSNIFTNDAILPIILEISPTKNFTILWGLPTTYEWFKKIISSKISENPNIKEEILELKILIMAAYKISIAKQQILNLTKIKSNMHQIYGSIKTWDRFKLANHEKDKKRFKNKKK